MLTEQTGQRYSGGGPRERRRRRHCYRKGCRVPRKYSGKKKEKKPYISGWGVGRMNYLRFKALVMLGLPTSHLMASLMWVFQGKVFFFPPKERRYKSRRLRPMTEGVCVLSSYLAFSIPWQPELEAKKTSMHSVKSLAVGYVRQLSINPKVCFYIFISLKFAWNAWRVNLGFSQNYNKSQCVWQSLQESDSFFFSERGKIHKNLQKAKAITHCTLSAKPLSRLKHT